jgi:hypothetical protein
MGGRSVITIGRTLSGVAAILNPAARHYTLAAGWNKENRSLDSAGRLKTRTRGMTTIRKTNPGNENFKL